MIRTPRKGSILYFFRIDKRAKLDVYHVCVAYDGIIASLVETILSHQLAPRSIGAQRVEGIAVAPEAIAPLVCELGKRLYGDSTAFSCYILR